MKKIFMAGVGGMLGEAFYQAFSEEYQVLATDKDTNAQWLSHLDFRDFDRYAEMVTEFDPDYLFHIGAHTSLEYCESNEADAYLTNTLAVEKAVNIANQLDIPLLYVSTAGIFDGSKDYFDDWDQPNPLGVYARSKFLGERRVVEGAKRYLVCRAGWMMGGGLTKDKKFIAKLMKQIRSGADTIYIVDDKDGTPTYTVDFAQNCKSLIEAEAWGLYNLVCGGQTSRLEVARELLSLIDRDDIVVEEVSSDYFAEEYYAPRPPNERLMNLKLNLLGLNEMSDWRDALRRYVETGSLTSPR